MENEQERDHLSVRIDPELLKAFKMGVLDKHGSLYGVMAREVEQALRMWLGNPWTKKKKKS